MSCGFRRMHYLLILIQEMHPKNAKSNDKLFTKVTRALDCQHSLSNYFVLKDMMLNLKNGKKSLLSLIFEEVVKRMLNIMESNYKLLSHFIYS